MELGAKELYYITLTSYDIYEVSHHVFNMEELTVSLKKPKPPGTNTTKDEYWH